jgi:hypothetical protein
MNVQDILITPVANGFTVRVAGSTETSFYKFETHIAADLAEVKVLIDKALSNEVPDKSVDV